MVASGQFLDPKKVDFPSIPLFYMHKSSRNFANIYLFSNVLTLYVVSDGLVRRFLRGENGVYFDRPSLTYDQKDFVPVEVKAGSLVVIHGDLIHQRWD